MRIGVFSGSFDPIHTGHCMVANYVAQWTGLDEVWLMVSALNPLKEGSEPAAESHRLAMARIAAEECSNVHVSDFELSLPKPSFTYRTLTKLRDSYPQHQFILIIGSDNWMKFNEWRDYKLLAAEFEIMVYPRPGYDADGSMFPKNVKLLGEAPQALISSTFVRDSVKEKKNLNFFLPVGVFEYIKEHKLYGY